MWNWGSHGGEDNDVLVLFWATALKMEAVFLSETLASPTRLHGVTSQNNGSLDALATIFASLTRETE
jgi:hypothetical protein